MTTTFDRTKSRQTYKVRSVTESETLSLHDFPMFINNTGATGSATVTLPPLSSGGEELIVQVTAAQSIIVTPSSGDAIYTSGVKGSDGVGVTLSSVTDAPVHFIADGNGDWTNTSTLGINSVSTIDYAIGGDALAGINLLFTGAKVGGSVGGDRSRAIKVANTVTLDSNEDTNGYDYQPTITSTESDAGHASGYQSRQEMRGGGTFEHSSGYMTNIVVENGTTVTDLNGYRHFDADTEDGSITNQYGYWCETLGKATNNFAWYSEYPNVHRFGGNITMHRRGATTSAATISGVKARGDEDTPTQAQTGDLSLQMQALAYNNEGTPAIKSIANIKSIVVASPTASSSPGKWVIQTTPTGSTTLTDAVEINESQELEMLGTDKGIILTSPDATRYRAKIANGGTWTIAAV